MAKIPLGDFGQVTARPAPMVQADPDAYGAAVGRAAQHAGNVGMAIAGDEMAQQQAEARRVQREQDAEAKAAAREANRVQALTAQATIQNGLADLHDEVDRGLGDGTIDKGKAAEVYSTRSQKLLDDGIKDVDPEHQGLVRASLLNDLGRGRASVGKMVGARNKADIMAGGVSYIEEMQRFAARGTQEADQAIANVRDFWTATGPMAGEDPAKASARVQQFAERVRYQQATSLVNADPAAALKALKDNKYLPELDPQQRTALIQTADVRMTQAANRAELHAQANERKLAQEWKGITTVVEAGKALDPAYAAAASQKFKGTPYEASLNQLMEQGSGNAALAGQPLPKQQDALDEMQRRMNQGGATPQQVQDYERASKAHKAAQADFKADPYQAAAERGVLRDLTPLDLTKIDTLPQQLAKRVQDAAVVSQWAGEQVSPFRPAEAHKVGEVLSALPPKDRAGVISGMSKVMSPPQMRAFSEQMGAKGDDGLKYALLYSNAWTSAGRRTSELILAGQQAKKDGTSTKGLKEPELKATQWSSHIATELRDLFPSQKLTDEMVQAGTLVAHGLAAEASGQLSKDDLDRAVRFAINGTIVEHNGRRVPVPAGMDGGALEKRLRTMTAAELSSQAPEGMVRAGGVPMPLEEFVKTLPGQQLMPLRQGVYSVLVSGRPVVNAKGMPIAIEIR
jgi:hypothetical protein